jgi:hypothetical protein
MSPVVVIRDSLGQLCFNAQYMSVLLTSLQRMQVSNKLLTASVFTGALLVAKSGTVQSLGNMCNLLVFTLYNIVCTMLRDYLWMWYVR